MHYVYLLRSESHPDQTYVGYTTDLRARMLEFIFRVVRVFCG